MENWFVLFAGSSPDGRGTPEYVGRTTDVEKAKQHLFDLRKSPYGFGHVDAFIGDNYVQCHTAANLNSLA